MIPVRIPQTRSLSHCTSDSVKSNHTPNLMSTGAPRTATGKPPLDFSGGQKTLIDRYYRFKGRHPDATETHGRPSAPRRRAACVSKTAPNPPGDRR